MQVKINVVLNQLARVRSAARRAHSDGPLRRHTPSLLLRAVDVCPSLQIPNRNVYIVNNIVYNNNMQSSVSHKLSSWFTLGAVGQAVPPAR